MIVSDDLKWIGHVNRMVKKTMFESRDTDCEKIFTFLY